MLGQARQNGSPLSATLSRERPNEDFHSYRADGAREHNDFAGPSRQTLPLHEEWRLTSAPVSCERTIATILGSGFRRSRTTFLELRNLQLIDIHPIRQPGLRHTRPFTALLRCSRQAPYKQIPGYLAAAPMPISRRMAHQ